MLKPFGLLFQINEVLYLINNLSKMITLVGYSGNVVYTSLIFVDLFLTLRNPFYPRGKRYPVYALLGVSAIVVTIIWLYLSIKDHGSSLTLFDQV